MCVGRLIERTLMCCLYYTVPQKNTLALDGATYEISTSSAKDIPMASIFFFSSRRRHTRLQGDWSSDVCSSDLSQEASRTLDHHRADGHTRYHAVVARPRRRAPHLRDALQGRTNPCREPHRRDRKSVV